MSDEIDLPRTSDLEMLSDRSKSAFSLRCALRVLPLLTGLDNPPRDYKKAVFNFDRLFKKFIHILYRRKLLDYFYFEVVLRALRDAVSQYEDFNKNTNSISVSQAIRSCASATLPPHPDKKMTFEFPINSVFFTENNPFEAAYFSILATQNAGTDATREKDAKIAQHATRSDFEKLKTITGELFDVSETGPLGNLWGGPPPSWYPEGKEHYDKTIAEWERELSADESTCDEERLLSVYVDPGTSSPELITELYVALNALYRANGGSGLEIVKEERRSMAGEVV